MQCGVEKVNGRVCVCVCACVRVVGNGKLGMYECERRIVTMLFLHNLFHFISLIFILLHLYCPFSLLPRPLTADTVLPRTPRRNRPRPVHLHSSIIFSSTTVKAVIHTVTR